MNEDVKSAPVERTVIHAPGQQEHTLCGMAFDAYESGDPEHQIFFAKQAETITCGDCRDEIDYVRKAFKRYKYVGV